MSAASPTSFADINQDWRAMPGGTPLVFGVFLPLLAIIVELTTRMCAQSLFDPLPTIMHTALVLLVPAINFATWRSLRRRQTPRWLAFGNGAVIGITLFYSVLFAPLLPVAVVGIIWFGLGLLPWAPPLALLAALALRANLRHATDAQSRPATWPGAVCGLLALIALDVPETITRAGMRLAASEIPAEQARGIGLLRSFGNNSSLLRLCYVRTGRTTDLLSLAFDMSEVSVEQARQIYYRVNGTPFNSVPVPSSVRHGRLWDDFDVDQGTNAVGGRLRGLSLLGSRLDGSLDAEAALGYLEWTLILENDSPQQREGRAQIALPPGAVVSRLTLWIDGEEREAAFAARNQVVAAYQSVVQQRRDPVLVTTAGVDRILVQMFPVPPNAQMKARIGISVPLQLQDAHEARLQLPYFNERNFEVPGSLQHALWIDAKTSMSSSIGNSKAGATSHSLRLDVADKELAGTRTHIKLARTGRADSWTHDGAEHLVRQSLLAAPLLPPARTVVVVDGSASMRPHVAPLAAALAKAPPRTELVLIVADDEGNGSPVTVKPQAVAAALDEHDFVGGHDNTAALARGLDAVMAAPDTTLIWIHGPQPVLLQTAEAIEQRIERGGKVREWYDVQLTPGPNLLAGPIEALQRVHPLTLEELEQLFVAWERGTPRWTPVRTRAPVSATDPLLPDQHTSAHLARLWANDEVARLLGQPDGREAAGEIAQKYQLVTPVSGAVVLETAAQYRSAGLSPVAPGTVPSIPEPHEWVLLSIAALMLGLTLWRQRGVRAHAA